MPSQSQEEVGPAELGDVLQRGKVYLAYLLWTHGEHGAGRERAGLRSHFKVIFHLRIFFYGMILSRAISPPKEQNIGFGETKS